MAVIRTSQPNYWSAVYNPIIYKFLSDFESGLRISGPLTPDTLGDSNGLLQITFLTAHGYSVGDYVEFANGDAPGYYRVTSTPSSTAAIFNTVLASSNNLTQLYLSAYQYNMSVRVLNPDTLEVYGLKTVKAFDDGTDITFTFDIASILQTLITSDLPDLTSNTPQLNSNSYLPYRIQFREEWIKGIDGESTYFIGDWQDDRTSGYYEFNDKVASNSCEQYNEQVGSTYKQLDFLIGGTGTRILTNQPDDLTFCSGKKYFLYINNVEIPADDMTVEVKQYDISDTLLSTSTIAYSGFAFVLGQHALPINGGLFTLSTDAYSITFQLKGTGIDSELITYKVSQNCCSPSEYQLYWLNNKGGYSSHIFTGKATHGLSIDRLQPIKYNLQPDNWAPSNRQFGNLSNSTREVLTLRYETSNVEIIQWLSRDLLSSIDAVMVVDIDGTDYLIPVFVETNSLSVYKDRDKRYSLSVDISYGFEYINQTR